MKALEDMVKLGQMDMATFERLRDEIVGGDVKDVHLVKGLDWKLLERIRQGEDVLAESRNPTKSSNGLHGDLQSNNIDVDEELEKVEGEDIQPVAKARQEKKGKMALPSAVAGKKRNRDDILREWKASRSAAAEKEKQTQQPSLGPRFTKVGDKRGQSRIEKDERGREILITVDEDGRVKRKVKRVKAGEEMAKDRGLLMPDKDAKPLGMEVPEILAPTLPEDKEDDNIFADVGTNYDPLGGAEDEEEGSDENGQIKEPANDTPRMPLDQSDQEGSQAEEDRAKMPPPALPNRTEGSTRNYFGDTTGSSEIEVSRHPSNPLTDPTILAALKKASSINPLSTKQDVGEEEAAKLARRRKMLESHDRDADDMDLGFGSSRFEDEEDGEEKKVKLSVWGQQGGDEDGKGEGNGKRKRGPKKRKGDANNAADVLKVMEARKGESK